MGTNEVKEFLSYLNDDGIDSISTFVSFEDALNSLAWLAIRGLASIVDGLYNAVLSITKALSFASSSTLMGLTDNYQYLLYGILIISISFLGFYLLFKKGDGPLNTIETVLILVVIVSSMPFITSKLTNVANVAINGIMKEQFSITAITKESVTSIGGGKQNSSNKAAGISDIVVANNIVDLKAVDEKMTSSKPIWRKNGVPRGYIYGNSIFNGKWKKANMVAKFHGSDSKHEEVWGKYSIDPADIANVDLKDFKDTKWTFVSNSESAYYRYQTIKGGYPNIFIMLIILTAVLLCVCIKAGRLVFEIAATQIYAPFIAATDLASGQRIKELIKNFFGLFLTLLIVIMLLGFYFAGFSWIESVNWGDGFQNMFIKLLLHGSLAWLIIDGPNTIEKILGIDAGLKSGWGIVMTAAGANMAGQQMHKGARDGAKSIGKGIAGLGKSLKSQNKNGGVGPSSPKNNNKPDTQTANNGGEANTNGTGPEGNQATNTGGSSGTGTRSSSSASKSRVSKESINNVKNKNNLGGGVNSKPRSKPSQKGGNRK